MLADDPLRCALRGDSAPTRLFWGSQPGLIRVPRTAAGEPGRPLLGSVRDVEPLQVELVREPAQRLLFRELVGRYHYLGHRVPFGAHLRYLVFASRPARAVVGYLQFSSPAWRMAARDRWIGWDDPTRARNLQRVVNNSRFLLLPWVASRCPPGSDGPRGSTSVCRCPHSCTHGCHSRIATGHNAPGRPSSIQRRDRPLMGDSNGPSVSGSAARIRSTRGAAAPPRRASRCRAHATT